MGKLYHYCTVETLKCILQYKTLRLADIRKSNDSKEINYLFEKYAEWASKNKNINVNAFLVDQKIQLENTVFLVSCFSRKEDDLHMWSCYANKGVCVEFYEDLLEKYIDRIHYGLTEEFKKMNVDINMPCLHISDVNYHNDASINTYFNNVFKVKQEEYDFAEILFESPYIKSDFFKSEEEVRIVNIYFRSF